MSKLAFMETLLNGAEGKWLSFGEIATIQRGASPRPIASYITSDDNGIPWIKIGDTSAGSKYVNDTAQRITKEGAKRYIKASLKRKYAIENGTELNEALPKMTPVNPQYKTKKQTVFQKIVAFVDKFKGVGGRI